MRHTYIALLSIAMLETSCERSDQILPEHNEGNIVQLRLTGEKVIIIRHVYPAFTYDDGVYDVRHTDGHISEVKPLEIEKHYGP